jgi:putative ABC transport system permease protein
MITDLRQAFRSLTSSKGFSALVIVVVAVGIGATSAIFSIINGVLLEPLPFQDASRLIAIRSVVRGERDSASVPDFRDWSARSKTIDHMAAYTATGATLTGRSAAVSLHVTVTTSDLFNVLAAPPLRGRTLLPGDDVKNAPTVAVISESMWQRHFNRADSVIGQVTSIDAKPVTIVGIMPASFQFPIQADPIDAWLPIGAMPLFGQFAEQRGAHFVEVIARLAPGASLDRANAELSTIAADLARAYPSSNANRTADAHPLQEELVREYRTGLIVLLAAVAAVLLIACANVANLLLARGTTRRKELAIRSAIGASRGRLIRQLLAESTLLSVVGGTLGILVAVWAVQALIAASPLEIPRLQNVSIDRGVVLFTTAITMTTGILFGIAPALLLSREDGGHTLKDADRGSSGAKSARTRQTLVVAEVSLALVLLTSAGLLVRTFAALRRVDPGFVAEHAVAAEVTLPKSRYPDAKAQIAFYHRIIDEMRGLPGVVASAVTTTVPLSGNNLGLGFSIDGRPLDPGNKLSATYFAISPDYFAAMGVRLVRGRAFTDRDSETSSNVVIVSESLARKHFSGQDPLGQRISIGYNSTGPREIVGVVTDVKHEDLAEAAPPEMYTPFPQTPWPFLSFVVRSAAEPSSVMQSLRSMMTRLDPDQALGDMKPVADYISKSIAEPRFTAGIVGAFATVALLLAGFGLFSVMAYSVAQRRREIGIRMALGAQPADVRSLVVYQALRLGGAGLLLGLAGAVVASRLLATLLFGVTPNDPATFAGVAATLTLVLLVAAYLPARRATRVDPTVALRTE